MIRFQTLENWHRVQFILEGRTDHLNGQDLLMITEVARRFNILAHIHYGVWEILVGVPKKYHRNITEIIQAMNYECYTLPGVTCDLTTLVLRARKERK